MLQDALRASQKFHLDSFAHLPTSLQNLINTEVKMLFPRVQYILTNLAKRKNSIGFRPFLGTVFWHYFCKPGGQRTDAALWLLKTPSPYVECLD